VTIGIAAIACLVLVIVITFMIFSCPGIMDAPGDKFTLDILYYLAISATFLFVIFGLAWCVSTMAADYNISSVIDKVIK
jgi:hypothetical protein